MSGSLDYSAVKGLQLGATWWLDVQVGARIVMYVLWVHVDDTKCGKYKLRAMLC